MGKELEDFLADLKDDDVDTSVPGGSSDDHDLVEEDSDDDFYGIAGQPVDEGKGIGDLDPEQHRRRRNLIQSRGQTETSRLRLLH